jgi:hypothetical protein
MLKIGPFILPAICYICHCLSSDPLPMVHHVVRDSRRLALLRRCRRLGRSASHAWNVGSARNRCHTCPLHARHTWQTQPLRDIRPRANARGLHCAPKTIHARMSNPQAEARGYGSSIVSRGPGSPAPSAWTSRRSRTTGPRTGGAWLSSSRTCPGAPPTAQARSRSRC